MEPRGSMPHSQGFFNNPCFERINPIPRTDTHFFNIRFKLYSHLRLGLPKGLFPVGLPVKILKALLPPSILATLPVYLNLLDLITMTIVGSRYKL